MNFFLFFRVFGLVNLYILNQNYKCMDKKREILSFELMCTVLTKKKKLMCTVFGHHVSKLGGFFFFFFFEQGGFSSHK